MLRVENISHTYGKGPKAVTALNDITADFPTGTTALLGPNGSGKSTLMNVLGTQLSPTGGAVLYEGAPLGKNNIENYRAQVGVVPQHITLPPRMRLHDILKYLTWVHRIPAGQVGSLIDTTLEKVQLTDKKTARVGDLSGGQLRRAGFACALLHRPSLILLDEPTVGLDPEVRLEIRRFIGELAESATVIVSTHLLEDVRFLTPKVVMINRGDLAFDGSYEQFIASLPEGENGLASSIENAYQSFLTPGAHIPTNDQVRGQAR